MKRLLVLAALATLAAPAALAADDGCIAMLGTGSVGGALGPRFAALGERVVYGSRSPGEERVQGLVARTGGEASAVGQAEAAQACAIVVLAVPWSAVEGLLPALGGLDGKLIVDVTNPLGVRQGREVAYPVQGSGAEVVQSLAPGARVVKAFNTINYRVMAHPGIAGGPVSVPLSGDDPAAKARVAELAAGIGLVPIDVGPLHTARYTEAMALLLVNRLLAGQPFDYQLHPMPARPAP